MCVLVVKKIQMIVSALCYYAMKKKSGEIYFYLFRNENIIQNYTFDLISIIVM